MVSVYLPPITMPLITRAAHKHQLDPALIRAVITQNQPLMRVHCRVLALWD